MLATCGGDGGGAADDTTGTSDGESTGTTTSADESSTGACGSCISAAPEDWRGPVFVAMTAVADPIPSCLVGAQLLEAFSGLDAPVHTCMCECGGGVCSGELECGMDPACADAAAGCADVEPDTCTALPEGTTSVVFSTASLACTGMTMPSIPEASFATRVIGCAAATEEPCDAGFCANPNVAPFDSGPCVWIDYDTDCPGEPYTQKQLLYRGFDDQRECSTCGCASAGGGQCGGAGDLLELHGSEACDAPVGMIAPAGWSCADTTGATHVRFVPESAGGCEISEQSTASGEVLPTGPITLCCAG